MTQSGVPPLKGGMTSMLDLTPDEEARIAVETRAEAEALTKVWAMVHGALLKRYEANILSFEMMCRYAERFARQLPERRAHRLLGELIEEAVHRVDAPKTKGDQDALGGVAAEMVDFGYERDGKPKTARFDVVAETITAMGVEVNAAQVQRWYYEEKK